MAKMIRASKKFYVTYEQNKLTHKKHFRSLVKKTIVSRTMYNYIIYAKSSMLIQ